MERLKAGAVRLGIDLTPEQLERFERYYVELTSWNRHMNLTSVTEYEEVQVKHFLDSLTVLPVLRLEPTAHLRLMDVGAGAGFPGVPLKIAAPGIDLVLLEATTKKADFLQNLVEKLDLKSTAIVNDRAENAAHDARYREKFGAVVARAVAALPALAELTLPFCSPGGVVIAQKKGEIKGEVESAARAISEMGGKLEKIEKIELEGLADRRCLVVIRKEKTTPERYPRRPGIPAKRPVLDTGIQPPL